MRFDIKYIEENDALEKLIAKGEGEQLDFKQSISNAKKIAKTLVAFANTTGGKLLIGVNDSGLIVGCEIEEEMYMIDLAITQYCQPKIAVEFSVYEFDEMLNVLVVDVKNNSIKQAYFSLDDNDEWQYYIRHRDKTIHTHVDDK
ncbi:MAG TPA: ATP-binding protein [Chitinophagales bacterium]|nr:ATP-binding protein [Chitinophagales bacterium]HMX60065.1 ATP-binding protein [Chitinophagales bacterium]HMY23679.1 ATP-binding protein [Chitinophagales bacterium]HMZ32476.1 ATP-binding protein [Chitinophagales bacterium]HNA39565.1 ATP-binding protein [Chitinophagales bacterium]